MIAKESNIDQLAKINLDMANSSYLSLKDVKQVTSDHEVDKYIKFNGDAAVFISSKGIKPDSFKITMVDPKDHKERQIAFTVQPCGAFVKLVQTKVVTVSSENDFVLKKSGLTKETPPVNKSSGPDIDFSIKGCGFKYSATTQYDSSSNLDVEFEVKWYQTLNPATYYLYQSALVHAYKLNESVDQKLLMDCNRDFEWRTIGNDLYFFTATYRNDYVLRKTKKDTLYEQTEFIDYIASNPNILEII